MARGSKWSVWCCVFFVILRVIRTELLHFDSIGTRKSPAPDFVRHTIIKPKIYHGREKREISSTQENVEEGHIHDLTVGYDVNGTDYVLDLRLNRELIPERYFTRYQHNGRHVINRPTGRDAQLCQYQGHIRGRQDSWAAISTCHGLSGVIFDGKERHYLEPGSGEEHFLYKHSDITTNQTCGYSGTPHHILENNDFSRIYRSKRSSEAIRGPFHANRQSRYLELVLVVDNREYKELGESLAKVNNHCKDIANIINALYQPLNIFIALVGVVVWTERDEIQFSLNGDTTLTNFLHYRQMTLIREHPNDNAQLLMHDRFENGVVGKALKGPICTYEFSGGVSTHHSPVVGLVATTVAHMIGHNLGMEHDTAECNCPSDKCIMTPSSSSVSPTEWSSCSREYVAAAFDHGMDYCLRNKPTSLFDSPVCGNGFVEVGEQCDCGLKDQCDNPCCNATSCMLYSNATCATGECCDFKTCRPKSAGSECRRANYECDLPEYCTGQGEYCPDDVFKMDGETCNLGKAFCYQGSCQTRTEQCKLLWGPTGRNAEKLCYDMNTRGTRHGNCGYDKLNQTFFKCKKENVNCGRLHCEHLNERLEFGMESVSILSHSFLHSEGRIIRCRAAIIDLGLNDMDPGLVPNGANCGDGKMCVNQKCMAVGSLRHQTGACPMDCNGNGVCNSKGHCHCKVGFSPPLCDNPGNGGSQDSGPAPDSPQDSGRTPDVSQDLRPEFDPLRDSGLAYNPPQGLEPVSDSIQESRPASNLPSDTGPASNLPSDTGPASNLPSDTGPASNLPSDTGPASNPLQDSGSMSNPPQDSITASGLPQDLKPASDILQDSEPASNINGIRKGPSPDFIRHTIVKPKIYHGRNKREIPSTRDNVEGGHIHDLTIGYDVNGTDFVLDLQLNRELIPQRFFTRYQHGGRHVVNRPTGRDVQLCQYQGHIRGRQDSWAAISTCHGLSGMIFDGEELHYLEPGSDEEHFLYKHSDITTNQTCGYSGTPHHILENNDFNRILRYKRSSGVIRGPYNANRQSRYVELVLVVDNKEYKELGESLAKVNNHCKEIANIINALYQPLNIFIALVGVVVWTETDEISLSHNGDTTLTNFLHYRRERLVKEHPNDNAQLLTRWQFEGGVVGKALKGPICTFEFSGGVSMDHSSVVGLVATTVAHEMGHNLGMEHDSAECNCPSDRCIMAPSSSSLSPTQWSSCSLDYLAVAFDHGMDYCLRNKPTSLFDSPVCGNGFVEAGEQCDCGLKDRCDNPCCNATSCMLYSNASCATGECCDLKTCRPKSAGSECRSAYHECDLPEYCTGQGEYCPDDVFKMDGETCDRGKAFCYQGSCRTHTDQCKLLWGPSGKSSDTLCYQMNTNGTRHGNCGFNKLNRSYIKCMDENIYCGMLHCRHLNERLEFGMESVSILSHSFINSGGSIIPCRTAIVDLGLNEVDPGLAPDGAKCGDGKMCVNQKCMAVGSLRHQTGACPMDCNGNGVCNSKGHCHCKVGFSPPHCDYPGSGGSQDSGPASDPNAKRDFMTALYIIFLGIVPLCALVAMFVYYTRHRATAFWKKSPLASDSSTPMPDPKSPPRHIGRGNSTAFRDRSQSPHVRALEISSPLNARHGSDNAHASLLSDPTVPNVQIVGSNPAPTPAAASLQTNLFGHFKGFSITPIASNASNPTSPVKSPSPPLKAAPPPPRITTTGVSQNPVRNPSRLPNLGKSNSVLTSNSNSAQKPPYVTKSNSVLNHPKPNNSFLNSVNSASISPALPPANSNSSARPLISSPVLDTTTCTVKELSSVRHPTRSAPDVPGEGAPLSKPVTAGERPLSSPNNLTVMHEDTQKGNEDDTMDGKVKEGGSYPTLTRLASFMLRQNSQDKKNKGKVEKSNSLPKSQVHGVKANKLQIDREALRNIQISNPIPQQDMEIPDNITLEDLESAKQVVMRAQSLRDSSSVKKRAEIPTFGSMRGGKRPTSIPPSARPTSPPPRPPPPPQTNPTPQDPGIIGLPGYQNPTDYCYDDCFNLLADGVAPLANIDEESPTSDNIYAVIEESPPGDARRKMRLDGDYSAPKSEPHGPKIAPLGIRSKFEYSAPTFSEYKTPKPIENSTSAGSVESVGLLSEIVNEIQARNVESIYSASTAERKKKEGYISDDDNGTDVSVAGSSSPQLFPDKTSSNSSLGTYVNASNIYRPTGSVYSNMSNQKSSASSTCSSNGYLSPTPKIPPTAALTTTPTSGSTSKPTTTPSQVPASNAPSLNSFQNKSALHSASNLNSNQTGVGNAVNKNLNSFSASADSSGPGKPNPGFKPTASSALQTRKTPEPTTEGYKPYSSSLHRSPGPFAASFKNTEASKPQSGPSSISNTQKPKDEAPQSSSTSFKSPIAQTSKPPVPSIVASGIATSKENVEPISRNSKLPTKPLASGPKPNITPAITSQRDPIPPPQKSTSNLPSKTVFNRSPTPPNLLSKQPGNNISKPSSLTNSFKASPIANGLPKKVPGVRSPPVNSPDLVSSCSNGSNSNKSPDVLRKTTVERPQIEKQTKPINSGAKVGVNAKQFQPKPPERVKTESEKPKFGSVNSSFGDKNKFSAPKDNTKSVGIGKSVSDVGKSGKISNVASLQQKFETAGTEDKAIGNVTSRTLSNVAVKKRPNISPSTSSSFKK